MQVHTLHADWGHPKTTEELTDLFLRYLDSEVSSTPFSSSPLSAESLPILIRLKALTKQGLWTISSQPAVDSAESKDHVYGWGPHGGYVSQKAFVEFFAEEAVVDRVEEKIKEYKGGSIHYFAANLQVRTTYCLADCT